jgi:hypothetical protein
MRTARLAIPVLALLLALPARARAADPDIHQQARSTAAQLQKTAVTIRLVLKVKMGMMGQTQDNEQKVDTTGTVIDPSGLTVVDTFSIDPTMLMK